MIRNQDNQNTPKINNNCLTAQSVEIKERENR